MYWASQNIFLNFLSSNLQRKLQIGYNRAARIIDQLEEQGYISQANHVGKREINFDKFGN